MAQSVPTKISELSHHCASDTAAAPADQPFTDCRALRATYPRGIKRPSAKNVGPGIRRGVIIDAAAYRLDSVLDFDRDSIACEVRRLH